MTAVLVLAVTALAALPAAAGPRPYAPPAPRYGRALAPGDAVGPVEGRDLDGKPVRIAYAGHRLTLVNFWATWCAPCRQEMPALETIRATHAGDGLQVAGLLINDPAAPEAIREAVAGAGVTYPIVAVPAEVEASWGGLTLLPTTFLVDGRGKLVRKFVGTDEKGMEHLARDVADYLAGRPLGNPYVPPSVPEQAPAR